MTHILFFEPPWSERQSTDWALRGGYKYRSLLGDLPTRATVTIAMSQVPPPEDANRRTLQQMGVRFRTLNSIDDARIWYADDLARDMGRLIEAMGADLVSNLNGRVIGYNFAMAKAAQDVGIDYVYRVAGNDVETRSGVIEANGRAFHGTALHAALLAQERFSIDAARRVIVMNTKEARRLTALGARAEQLQICFRGVDRAHFAPAPDPATGATRFLYVGRQSFEKGYDKLEAAADDIGVLAPDIRFTFAGDFPPGDSGNRSYPGFVSYDGLPAVYRAHDVLVVCSRSEGFPQVIMEAMACGLPCILSASLFGQDFSDGEDALLVDQDWQAVRDAVLRLHRDPVLFARLRTGAITRARAAFDETVNRSVYHRTLLEAAHG